MNRILLAITTMFCMFMAYEGIAEDSTSTQLFCAYGNMFVEFKDKNHTWGTLWLDRNGRPVPCKEGAPVSDSNYKKEENDKSI